MTDLCVNSHGDVVPKEKWPCLRGGASLTNSCMTACVCARVLGGRVESCVGA